MAIDPEFVIVKKIVGMLLPLPRSVRARILNYVIAKLDINGQNAAMDKEPNAPIPAPAAAPEAGPTPA